MKLTILVATLALGVLLSGCQPTTPVNQSAKPGEAVVAAQPAPNQPQLLTDIQSVGATVWEFVSDTTQEAISLTRTVVRFFEARFESLSGR